MRTRTIGHETHPNGKPKYIKLGLNEHFRSFHDKNPSSDFTFYILQDYLWSVLTQVQKSLQTS